MAKEKREERGDRAVRSLRDVEKILQMHGSAKEGYRVRVVALHCIAQSASMQRLLRDQIRRNGWIVDGMQHVDGVVAIHGLISRSAVLLDRVIREVVLIQERGQPLPRGDVDRLSRVEDPVRFDSDEDFDYEVDYEVPSARPRLPSAIKDEERPLGEGHRGPRERFDSDIFDYEVMPSRPRLPRAIKDEERPLGEGHRGQQLRFDTYDDVRYEYEVLLARPRVPSALRRSRSDGCLFAPSRFHGGIGGPRLPLPLTVRRHDDAPRFDGPIPIAPITRPGDDAYPLFAADVEQEGGFRGQVLLLEYPHPRPIGTYAVNTINLAERMLEAGTGTGEQPLLRAPELVALAAMAVAGHSPPRHLDQDPALRTLVTELVESGQDLRRHGMGSDAVRSLVVELGGRLELVGTDILTARRPLPELLPLLREVKENLHLLWELRISSDQFKLM